MTAIELLKQDIDLEIKSGTKMVVNWDMYLEMEKQQIIDAAERWKGTDFAEKYYAETYGSKGSDDTSSQTEISDEEAIEMIKDMNKQPMRFHCVPKEISDEEVEMAALLNEPRVTRRAFRSGAKWYREQLKKKQ